ncbi:MAG: hypothetical protein HKP32_12085 [Woeseia sp.]|nr:hypothetical protein [Woeseia sp.]MBU2677820.1 hypothetical protein [Gammaproteobacteria bacterium]NNC57436.1 hypothetical protein [Woeseiaceae bacterium]NND46604.1 hypothetical protein [Woeseiaceae bacterium]NNL51553.1 hypothetical protein [Woeseiaceae bacterium]
MLESNGFKRILLLASALVTYSSGAIAQQVANQVLEEVIVATDSTALLADFEDTQLLPLEVYPDPVDINPDSGDIRACKKTGRGLFCLAGNEIRRWPKLTELAVDEDKGELVLNCRHPDLNLDTRKANTCTTMTMNAAGTEGWLGGKEKGKAYSLINFAKKQSGAACPADDGDGPWAEFDPATGYCWRMLESGRPLLVKIVRLDDTEELILLEERKTILSRVDGAGPDAIASSKSELGLAGNEQVLSIDVVDWNDAPYVLYTTTKDRVRAVNKNGTPSSFAVFDFETHRNNLPLPQQCDFNEQHYDIATGTDTGLVFATDRNYCLVIAAELAALNGAFELTPTKTLSTDPSLPPSYVTASPGINVNLANCAGAQGCNLIKNAAALTNVQLVPNLPTGMTLYQIIGIPDCRYIPNADGCDPSYVIGPAGNPAAQQLNITPLIPDEVKNALQDPLPVLLISRQYRGQFQNGFYFDAFLGITEPGVQFQGVFNGVYFVDILTGEPDLGCPLSTDNPAPADLGDLLAWDIVTTVSENFVSGTMPKEHRDMLINTDCGSSKTSDGRWSLKPYNLEVTPCTFNPVTGDVWEGDGDCAIEVQGSPDDAVFAKLLLSLYDDLGKALNEVACVDVDHSVAFPGNGTAPLSLSTCATLNAKHVNAKDKLEKCWDATQQPKQSAGSQNCQAFVSQLTSFSNTLALAPQNPNDVANRKGELQARVEVLFHLYFERFEPSIPAAGFMEP